MHKASSIVSRLREKHRPTAIILHGSRAAGHHRPRSDWDLFLLFFHEPEVLVGREEIEDEDVEWQALKVPIPEGDVLRRCGVQLQYARILWESDLAAGTDLLKQATTIYARGVRLTELQISQYRQYLVHKANGMEDDIETPYLFLRHQAVFLERASNWWFELRGEYRKPLYLAMPIILQRDPEYSSLLMVLASSVPNAQKVQAARGLISKLFSNSCGGSLSAA